MLRLIVALIKSVIKWIAILFALLLAAIGVSGIVESFRDAPLLGSATERERPPVTVRIMQTSEVRGFLFAIDYRADGFRMAVEGPYGLPPGEIMISDDDMKRFRNGNRTIKAYWTGRDRPILVSADRLQQAGSVTKVGGYAYTTNAYSSLIPIVLAGTVLWYAVRKRRKKTPVDTVEQTAQPAADHSVFYDVDAKYADMVKRLEAAAQDRPGAYRMRVLLASGLGFAYVGLIASVLIATLAVGGYGLVASGTAGAAILAKYLWPVAVLTLVIARAMWVRFPAPNDREVTRAEVPELFSFVESIGARLGAPPVDHIQLSQEFNAGIVQYQRLGLLGWTRNYLTIGLPLIKGLPTREFEAVIAHEFGHIVGGDGRFGNWVYRSRIMWAQVATKVNEKAQWGSFLFRRFLDWYVPWFNAYSFVAARAQEYAADQCAVTIAGTDATGAALVRARVRAQLLASIYWTDLIDGANDHPLPPTLPHAGMLTFFADVETTKRADAHRTLDNALGLETDLTDTHPSLKDRLQALGQSAGIRAPLDISAAPLLLGDMLDSIDREFDNEWWGYNETAWEDQFRSATEERQRLEVLDHEAGNGALSSEDAWERASLTEKHQGADPSIEQYAALFDKHPDLWVAALALGRTHLCMGNEAEGLAWIDRACALHQAAVVPAAEVAYVHYQNKGDTAAAEKYSDMWNEGQEIVALAHAERDIVSHTDIFKDHGLDNTELEQLIAQLKTVPTVKRAWLVRKEVQHFPDEPFYVLGVERPSLVFLRHATEKTLNTLTTEIEYPGETHVFVLSALNKAVLQTMQRTVDRPILEN